MRVQVESRRAGQCQIADHLHDATGRVGGDIPAEGRVGDLQWCRDVLDPTSCEAGGVATQRGVIDEHREAAELAGPHQATPGSTRPIAAEERLGDGAPSSEPQPAAIAIRNVVEKTAPHRLHIEPVGPAALGRLVLHNIGVRHHESAERSRHAASPAVGARVALEESFGNGDAAVREVARINKLYERFHAKPEKKVVKKKPTEVEGAGKGIKKADVSREELMARAKETGDWAGYMEQLGLAED